MATYDGEASLGGVQDVVNLILMAKLECLAHGLERVRGELQELRTLSISDPRSETQEGRKDDE